MPSKLIIIFIITKNGKIDGKTEDINNFPPYKAEFKHILGAVTMFNINTVQKAVINKFLYNVMFFDLNNLKINIDIAININNKKMSIII
ncbi:hypothetical protein [Clostridium haemolyticum]|uniref:hypothetical protein n=1 Tax=Clostridium haemolyticum TaxID=84025 RepID=UPI001FA923FE|nr:hypothetical protein [Clostridium haemolyticum]